MTGRTLMSDDQGRARRVQALIWAMLCEAACLIAGGIAFALTQKMLWIAIGVLGGFGFSIPAVIRFIRDAKGQDRASR
jgi:hypothetical protein